MLNGFTRCFWMALGCSFFLATFALNPSKEPTINQVPVTYRFTFDNVQVPNNPRMGLVGLHYLMHFKPWWQFGFAGYGAVSGAQGGLFSLGLETGLHKKLFGRVYANAGTFLGGGGGKSAQQIVGSGLMLAHYIGLAYDFNYFQLGLNYSIVNFPTGDVHSHQIELNLDIPSVLYYAEPNFNEAIFYTKAASYEKNYLMALEKNYFQKSGTLNTGGVVQDQTMHLLGIELGHYLTDRNMVMVQLAGGISGIKNGYMDVFLGTGYQMPVWDSRLSALAKFYLGAGGGGGVETGGGWMIWPVAGLNYAFTTTDSIEMDGGYLKAPSGNLAAKTLLIGWNHSLNMLDEEDSHLPETAYLTNWRFRFSNETYFHPARDSQLSDENIQLIKLKFDRFLNHYFYLTGQGSFAYAGYHAGSYAVGELGLGAQTIQQPKRFSLYSELLLGAAGGGGVAVNQGAILQPMIGVDYQFTPYLGWQMATGRVMAFSGKLNSVVVDTGLSLSFGKYIL